MKTVSICKVASDAPLDVINKLYGIINDINSRHKNGFNSIGETQIRDARNRIRSIIVAYDQKTMDDFINRCDAAGIDAAIHEDYAAQPHFRHYLEVKASGAFELHWHPKDTFIEIEPMKVCKRPIEFSMFDVPDVKASRVFFVGPSSQVLKASQRYKNIVRCKLSFSYGLTSDHLKRIVQPFIGGGEVVGGAMYIITQSGLIARITPSGFEWVTLRKEVGRNERNARIAYGYNAYTVSAGRDWLKFNHVVNSNTSRISEFDATLYKGLMTHDAYYKM